MGADSVVSGVPRIVVPVCVWSLKLKFIFFLSVSVLIFLLLLPKVKTVMAFFPSLLGSFHLDFGSLGFFEFL